MENNEKVTKVIFLSMRMHGRSIDDICVTRDRMKAVLTAMYPNETLGFIDNIHCEVSSAPDMLKEGRLLYLGEAIKKLAYCNYLAEVDDDWHYGAKSGCEIERRVAHLYGLQIISLPETIDGIYYPDLYNEWKTKCRKHNIKVEKVNCCAPAADYDCQEGGLE